MLKPPELSPILDTPLACVCVFVQIGDPTYVMLPCKNTLRSCRSETRILSSLSLQQGTEVRWMHFKVHNKASWPSFVLYILFLFRHLQE